MRRLLTASTLALVLLLAGCGDDGGDGGGGGDGGSEETLSGEELIQAMAEGGLTREQAECFAEEIGEATAEDAMDPEFLVGEGGEACLDGLGDVGDAPDLEAPDETIPDLTVPDVADP